MESGRFCSRAHFYISRIFIFFRIRKFSGLVKAVLPENPDLRTNRLFFRQGNRFAKKIAGVREPGVLVKKASF